MLQSNRMIEPLEGRQLLHGTVGEHIPKVLSVVADNRGEVQIQFSEDVTNVTKNTVLFFTAGADGEIGTADDVRKRDITVRNRGGGRVTIFGHTDVNATYRLRLLDDIASVHNGDKLDGDFNGTFPTGNGTAGGNFSFATRRDRTENPRLRFSTTAGVMDVRLNRGIAGLGTTISNFIDYANAGRLDNTIWHRKVTVQNSGIGIAQGGGFYSTAESFNGTFFEPSDEVPTFAPIPLQAGFLSNTRGTIAMARTNDPNSATSQFYFNATDNTVLDPTGPNTGYAVFGNIVNASGLATLDRIYGAPTENRGNSGVFGTLPILDSAEVVTRRVAVLHRVGVV